MEMLSPDQFALQLHHAFSAREATASQFCRRYGVAKSTVSAWFSGRALPRGRNLTRLSEFSGLSVQALLYGKTEEERTPVTRASMLITLLDAYTSKHGDLTGAQLTTCIEALRQ